MAYQFLKPTTNTRTLNADLFFAQLELYYEMMVELGEIDETPWKELPQHQPTWEWTPEYGFQPYEEDVEF